MKIGFIGLGNMGAPMARNLIAAGHEVVGFDICDVAVEGMRMAANAVEAAIGQDVVITMLPNGAILKSVAAEILPHMAQGCGFIDCSTVDVDAARAVAADADACGVLPVDAPVSGGIGGATAGTLTFMAGGSDKAFALALPLFEIMGQNAVHCGDSGAGQAAKICNNMILGITMIGTCEAFALADKLGLDRQKMFDVVSTSSGYSWSMNVYCPAPGIGPSSPSDHDYTPGFAAELMLKDLNLSQNAAKSANADTPLGAHAAELYRQFVEDEDGMGRDFLPCYRDSSNAAIKDKGACFGDDMTVFSPKLQKPNIERERDPLRLVSRDSGDVYFSAEDGLAEAELVFIEGNNLMARMEMSDHLMVAETGFGTGLNVLALLRYWKQLGARAPHLHFIATETAPLPNDLIRDALNAIPEIREDAEMLIKALPPHWPGRHRRHFFGGKVTLDLLYGDSVMMLERSQFFADAWFLNRHALSQNPEKWQNALFTTMAEHSREGATLASGTAEDETMRGLERAGFEVEQQCGRGRRITGRIAGKTGGGRTSKTRVKPQDRVAVIGAGVAGASVAAGLRRAGIAPIVIGKGEGPHDGASGNIAAVQSPWMAAVDSFAGQLSMAAYGYARWVSRQVGANLSDQAVVYSWNEREAVRQEKILDQGLPEHFLRRGDAEAMTAITGIESTMEGLIFDDGGAVDPCALTRGLMGDVETIFGRAVQNLNKHEHGWQISFDDGRDMIADHVVLAGGSGLARLTEGWLDPILPFQVTAGRMSHLPPQLATMKCAMSFGGYLVQASDGRIAIGASFDRNINANMGIDKAFHEENYALLPKDMRHYIPPPSADWTGRMSYRLATKDRQPVAGLIGEGLSMITALGARGMVTGPLLGEYVAGLMLDRPLPLDFGMASVVNPYRFSAKAGL